MTDSWLATSRHARDLIEHAEEHLQMGSERDLKFSLIHADNAIEALLKEHTRYGKRQRIDNIIEMSFQKLLDASSDIAFVEDQRHLLSFTHDMRNAVYHFGALTPQQGGCQIEY